MMTNKPPYRPRTMLDDVTPMSNEDLRKEAEEWADRTLDSLLSYAKVAPEFSKLLCKKVMDAYISDNELTQLMSQLLKEAKKGKSPGPRIRWTRSRYLAMLIHYEIRRSLWGRKDALEWTGHKEGIGIRGEQDFNPKKVEEKITKARREISQAELDAHLPDWAK